MQSPNNQRTSSNGSSYSNSLSSETPNNLDERCVNIVNLGTTENISNSSLITTTITVRCRDTVIKFSVSDPVSTVCAIVRSLESTL